MSSASALDEDALVRLYEPLIWRIAQHHWRYASNYLVLDDLLQICRITAVLSARRWDAAGGASLTTYIFRALQHACFNARRDQFRQLYSGLSSESPLPEVVSADTLLFEADTEGVPERVVDQLPSDVDVEQETLGIQLRAQLRDLIASAFVGRPIIVRAGRVIALRYGLVDGVEHSQQEVADELGISQMHVSRLERKGLERLRQVAEERGLAEGLA